MGLRLAFIRLEIVHVGLVHELDESVLDLHPGVGLLEFLGLYLFRTVAAEQSGGRVRTRQVVEDAAILAHHQIVISVHYLRTNA